MPPLPISCPRFSWNPSINYQADCNEPAIREINNIHGLFLGGTLTRLNGTTEPLDDNSDLWWSVLGGGGGTYGVVTQFKLKLYDAPPGGFVRLLMRFIILKDGECAGAAKEVAS